MSVRVVRSPWPDCVGQEIRFEESGLAFNVRHDGDYRLCMLGPDNVHLWGFEAVAAPEPEPAQAPRPAREIYDHATFVADLDAAVKEIRDLLVEKNQNYGNSALDPVRIFSRADPMEQLFVRIDDKLSRLKRGHAAGEDVVKDLQGYLLLVRVAQMRSQRTDVTKGVTEND